MILELLLSFQIFIDGLRVKKETACFLHTIVANSVEICLSISEERNIDLAGSYSLISAYHFHFMAVIAERDILSHQIDL